MIAKAMAASKVGLFGVILTGLGSLLLGIFSNFFSTGPMIYVAAMAGVLFPLVMVASGAMAMWASETPIDGGEGHIVSSLAAGLITEAGGSILCALTLAFPINSVFSGQKPIIDSLDLSWGGYVGIVVLIAAYIALAAIGGVLYRLMFPADGSGIF